MELRFKGDYLAILLDENGRAVGGGDSVGLLCSSAQGLSGFSRQFLRVFCLLFHGPLSTNRAASPELSYTQAMHQLAVDKYFQSFSRLGQIGAVPREPEDRGQKSEVGAQRSEVRSQRTEIRDQRSEVREQRSEVRDQRAVGKPQMSPPADFLSCFDDG